MLGELQAPGPQSPPRSTRFSTSTCRAGSGPRPAAGTAEPRPRRPRFGHTATGGIRDGPVVRTRTAPARPGQRMRMAATGAAPPPPRPTPCPRRHAGSTHRARPTRRTSARAPEGRAGSAPGERATAPARQAAKAETLGRALARPGPVWQQRDRLAARDCRGTAVASTPGDCGGNTPSAGCRGLNTLPAANRCAR
jgi:hypothetical protein